MAPQDAPGTDQILCLQAAIERSRDLEARIDEAWSTGDADAGSRAVAGLCGISLDHGRSVRTLLLEVPPSAIALLRPQYEALVRAAWAHYAATEAELSRLLSPLTLQGQQAAKKLPGVADMLAALENSGHHAAAAILGRARSRLWDGLNSFIHGGIHPFWRSENGYPATLLVDVLKNANGMSMLTLVLLGEITDDADVSMWLGYLQREFGEVLPSLEPLQAEAGI